MIDFIDIEPQLKELNILRKKMEWLINGYHVNCVLPTIKGDCIIPVEWIVQCYNVEISYFIDLPKDNYKKYMAFKLSQTDYELHKAINNLNEGWAIFHSLGDNGMEWRIEFCNDPKPVFEDDASAYRFVIGKALGGSQIHKQAINFILHNGRMEELKFLIDSISK